MTVVTGLGYPVQPLLFCCWKFADNAWRHTSLNMFVRVYPWAQFSPSVIAYFENMFFVQISIYSDRRTVQVSFARRGWVWSRVQADHPFRGLSSREMKQNKETNTEQDALFTPLVKHHHTWEAGLLWNQQYVADVHSQNWFHNKDCIGCFPRQKTDDVK